mmetsp:Transcript_8103/g.23921  ORF Transcript_8103/g.23921 Transcript_8103/m.23921 type:complete len:126 (+) Transcript_8103:57-434(+)
MDVEGAGAAVPPTDGAPASEDARRFEVELEFVQCLANPEYLTFLAQRGFFDRPAFVNYLAYLMYWKEAGYARHITYPHALAFLDLLQNENFRALFKHQSNSEAIQGQQILHWIHYNKNRIEEAGP